MDPFELLDEQCPGAEALLEAVNTEVKAEGLRGEAALIATLRKLNSRATQHLNSCGRCRDFRHRSVPEKLSRTEVAKALFWLIAGIAIVGYVGLKGVETYRIMRGGGQASGRIITTFDEVRESDDGRRASTVTVAEYEFFVGRVRFEGRTEGPQGSWSEGDELTVQFNPRDPNENRAAGDGRVLGDYFVLVILGLFAYFAIRSNVRTLAEHWGTGRRV